MDDNKSYDYTSSNYDGNSYANSSYEYPSDHNAPDPDQDENRKRRRYWIIIILLLLIGLLGFLAIWCLSCEKKKMHDRYEAYISNNRDSMAIVVADLVGRIDSLENEKTKLLGTIREKSSTIRSKEIKLKNLLANYDPEKYKKLLARVKELEEQVANLEIELENLRSENARLLAENKVLTTQVDTIKRKYDDLYQSYLACCGKKSNLGGAEPDDSPTGTKKGSTPKGKGEEDKLIFEVDNVVLKFVGIDKNGDKIKDEKLKISDITTFDIDFDALCNKSGDHLFYVRVTDSIEGNLVVPSDYAQSGKKILKLQDGEEVPYTYSVPYNYNTPDNKATVPSNFNPFLKQIRYLPYRVEIYDYSGKLAEGFGRPPSAKGAKKKAKWIW